MVSNFVYGSSLFFLITLPLASIFFSFIAVVLPSSKRKMLRADYQTSLIKLTALVAIVHIGFRFLIAHTTSEFVAMLFPSVAMLFPAIIYSIMVNAGARRLLGMGYSRFFALFGVLPILGPAALFWLAVSIHQRARIEI